MYLHVLALPSIGQFFFLQSIRDDLSNMYPLTGMNDESLKVYLQNPPAGNVRDSGSEGVMVGHTGRGGGGGGGGGGGAICIIFCNLVHYGQKKLYVRYWFVWKDAVGM